MYLCQTLLFPNWWLGRMIFIRMSYKDIFNKMHFCYGKIVQFFYHTALKGFLFWKWKMSFYEGWMRFLHFCIVYVNYFAVFFICFSNLYFYFLIFLFYFSLVLTLFLIFVFLFILLFFFVHYIVYNLNLTMTLFYNKLPFLKIILSYLILKLFNNTVLLWNQ